jgi:hypothetical protein
MTWDERPPPHPREHRGPSLRRSLSRAPADRVGARAAQRAVWTTMPRRALSTPPVRPENMIRASTETSSEEWTASVVGSTTAGRVTENGRVVVSPASLYADGCSAITDNVSSFGWSPESHPLGRQAIPGWPIYQQSGARLDLRLSRGKRRVSYSATVSYGYLDAAAPSWTDCVTFTLARRGGEWCRCWKRFRRADEHGVRICGAAPRRTTHCVWISSSVLRAAAASRVRSSGIARLPTLSRHHRFAWVWRAASRPYEEEQCPLPCLPDRWRTVRALLRRAGRRGPSWLTPRRTQTTEFRATSQKVGAILTGMSMHRIWCCFRRVQCGGVNEIRGAWLGRARARAWLRALCRDGALAHSAGPAARALNGISMPCAPAR